MKSTLTRALAAAFLCLAATSASADPFHFNVDWATMPAGPIFRLNASGGLGPGLNQYTIEADAYNSGGQTYYDVKLLLQFVYKADGFVFTDGTDTWTENPYQIFFLDANTLLPLPVFSMNDTDAPLSWTNAGRTGFLAPGDTVPYIQIGDMYPGDLIHFSWVGQANQLMHPFDITGSFVSLTVVPEPSSVVLLGVGAAVLLVARRLTRRAKN